MAGHIYHTPAGEPAGHWEYADAVTLSPLIVINTDEIATLTQQQYGNLLSERRLIHQEHDPARSRSIQERVNHRIRQQIELTLNDPALPPKHSGPLYAYVTGATSRTYFHSQAIIAHDAPLEFPPEDNAAHSALADAIYLHPNAHVPVWRHQHSGVEERQVLTLDPGTPVSFHHEKPTGSPLVNAAEFITVFYGTLPDARKHTVEADFSADGPAVNPAVCVSLCARNRNDLPQAVAAAFPAESDGTELGQRLRALTERARNGPDITFAKEMQNLADSFRPQSQKPDRVVSATSADGTLTVIYRPSPSAGATAATPVYSIE